MLIHRLTNIVSPNLAFITGLVRSPIPYSTDYVGGAFKHTAKLELSP